MFNLLLDYIICFVFCLSVTQGVCLSSTISVFRPSKWPVSISSVLDGIFLIHLIPNIFLIHFDIVLCCVHACINCRVCVSITSDPNGNLKNILFQSNAKFSVVSVLY
jgi:hypothetical protein